MSTPTDPAPGAGPVAYNPAPIPESATPLVGESPPKKGWRGLSRNTLIIAAVAFAVVGAGSFFGLNSLLAPGRDAERNDRLADVMDEVAGPEHVVQSYLDALAAGNARGAWAIASGDLPYTVDPTVADNLEFPEPSLLIDDDLYQGAESLPKNPKIDSVKFSGHNKATVTATYDLGGKSVSQEFALSHKNSVEATVYKWTFVDPPIGKINITAPSSGARLLINGVDVTSWVSSTGSLSVPALSGSYDLRLVDADGKDVDSQTVTVSAIDPVAVKLST